MRLSETTKYTIAALSIYGFVAGVFATFIGGASLYEIVNGEPLFGPPIEYDTSVRIVELGLGVGVPLTSLSGIIFYLAYRRNSKSS